MLQHIIFFDIEGTGVDPYHDRIVELAIYDWSGKPLLNTLVNPGIPIPPETTDIHGISDEDVADAPTVRALAPQVERIVEDRTLCGYNSVRYDVPMLDAELRRAGRSGLPRNDEGMIEVPEIDLYAVWQQAEPRTLVGAARKFAGVDLEGDAHRAGADTEVLPHILRGMLMNLDLGEMERPIVDRLRELSTPPWMVDRDGKFRRRDDGVVIFNFSNSRGQPATSDPGLLEWILRKDFSEETKAWARRLHAEAMQPQPAPSLDDDFPDGLPF